MIHLYFFIYFIQIKYLFFNYIFNICNFTYYFFLLFYSINLFMCQFLLQINFNK